MNVKKYRATTTREALEQVKQDLGDDAFVLETRQVKSGGFLGLRAKRQIEISAASSSLAEKPEELFEKKTKPGAGSIKIVDDSYAAPRKPSAVDANSREKILNALAVRASSAKNVENIIPKASKNLNEIPATGTKQIEVVELNPEAPKIVHAKKKAATAPKGAVPVNTGGSISKSDIDQIRAELREMKFSLNAFGPESTRYHGEVNFEKDSAIYDYPFYESYLELSKTGLDPERIRKHLAEFVPQFSNGALPSDNLTRLVLKRILDSSLEFFGDPLEKTKRLALIGATGVGKTTTIAKLAARATLQDGKNVELVTLDTYRIAAVEQLKTYSEIIGAGCHVVRTVEELDETLDKLGDESTVLIDTTGRSPYDLSDQFDVSDYLLNNKEIHKCLAIPATLNSHDALASIRKFDMYGANSLVLTKLDETSRPGLVLDTASDSKLAVSYFCMGQRVPEDIRTANAETIADQVMPHANTSYRMSA
ncbi:MAG: flagellar biosynthesis protein FlhF [Pyrinomonadaceae bacterium]|nr:flagellar biosynthesis protein FlhF [Pyrinomonadaceae bacterium]